MNRFYLLSLAVASILFAEDIGYLPQESIKIERFQIIGNKKIDTQILMDILQPYHGKALSAHDMKLAAEAITQKYRSMGFERARAYVPLQTIHENTLKFFITIDKKAKDEPEAVVVKGNKLILMNTEEKILQKPVVYEKIELEKKVYEATPKEEAITALVQHLAYASNAKEINKPEQEMFIQSLINEAVLKSPAVLSKDSSLQAALFGEEGAKWQYFPTPTLSMEQGESGQNITIARIQQPLWAGGRLDAEYNKAKKLSEVAKMSLSEIKQNLALYTCDALYSVLSAYGHKLVYEDAMERLEKHKEMIVRRVNQGISPDSELLLLNTRLTQAKTDLSMALASQEKALALLSQRLTRSITIEELSPILPKSTCKIHLPMHYDNPTFVETVLASHPGMERFQRQVESAGHDVEIKKAALLPTVYAKVEKQWDSSNEVDTKTSFVLGVQYSPGAGFSSLSAVETARANFLATQQEKENFQLELKQKVISELSDYGFTLKRYQNYVMAADTTQKTAESYDRLFIAGKRSWLDVLNAEREWSNAQISLSDVQAYLATTPMRLKIYASELEWQKGDK